MAEVQLSDRDMAVVRMVMMFKRLTARQIYDLVFYDVTESPRDRSLARLVKSGWLVRIERYRLQGGSAGGSGAYVYAPGRLAYAMESDGLDGRRNYRRPDSVSFHTLHTLAVADLYVEVLKKHRASELVLLGASLEPNCHLKVDRWELKPDMDLAVQRLDGSKLGFWPEVDNGTEGKRHIQRKLLAYTRAWQYWQEHDVPGLRHFRRVPFIANELRCNELRWYIEEFGNEHGLFDVKTAAEFIAELCTGIS